MNMDLLPSEGSDENRQIIRDEKTSRRGKIRQILSRANSSLWRNSASLAEKKEPRKIRRIPFRSRMRSASKSVYSYLKANKKSILIAIITYSVVGGSATLITYRVTSKIAFEKKVVVGVELGKKLIVVKPEPNRLSSIIEWGFYIAVQYIIFRLRVRDVL
jgi:hypothetical protein